MRRIVLGLAVALLAGQAHATTVNLASPTGNVGMGTDGTNLLAVNAMCGAASTVTLYATCVNQVTVNANGGMNTNILNSVLQVQSNSANLATQTTLAAILSALGSPFQAAASIGNTGFNALQAGAANTSGNPFFAQITNTNANGQATMANSSPVVIASDQSAVPVTANAGTNLNTSLLATDAHLTSFTSANHTDLTTLNTTLGSPMQATGGTIKLASPYPATAVPITASATGTTAATTATLTNVTGHTTYICGFSIRANATAAATGNATVTGTITATMNFTQWTAPNASGIGVTEETFAPCVPASAVSTSIAVVSAAAGTGGVVSVSAWGYSI